ncbi:MAG: OsmC family protein [Anaerolineae bacterium]|nr:OsmC family protein [Anaerolineae bacterium]
MEMEITFPGGARIDATYDDYVIHTDQPPADGGEGSAPAPFALFLASIGTCAGINILNFCHHRNIPTAEMRIRQRVEFVPRSRMVSRVHLDVLLPPDFPARYARAVVNLAQMCAVQKHLEAPPLFTVEAHLVGE